MKTLISWSSGKDSAWTFHRLSQSADYEIAGLVCTVNPVFGRSSIHGVRIEWVKAQAADLGLKLDLVELPFPCTNEDYERTMGRFWEQARDRGIECIAYGDLFLEDVRDYRKRQLKNTGLRPVFPLWQEPTDRLALEMIESGLQAVITTVDPSRLPLSYLGRSFDRELLRDLPSAVDPCGENGEFHTFVWGGPFFRRNLAVRTGRQVLRDGFGFIDLEVQEPASESSGVL